MGLFALIKSLFGGKPKRDISRLAPGEDAGPADAVTELVDVSGGPLKQNGHRRALRDKRLLPKSKSVSRQLGFSKRKAIMPKREADRLFAGTMRTRNRSLRDLLPDEEQLNRYGLPVWQTESDLAKALGISESELWFFGIHRERERQPHYVTFAIPKRTGGKRLIMAPKRRLKALQRKLLELLIGKLPVSEHAHGFRHGRSIKTGAQPHVGKKLLLRLDLKEFFPSVTFARVRGLLVGYGYGFPVATTLAVLMTEAERQPVEIEGQLYHVPVGPRHCVQGAPTSPGLCNAITLRLDRRLAGLAKKHGFSYTRYADDLSFSGDAERLVVWKLRAAAERIVGEEGFTLNSEKTRLTGQSGRQTVTGVVVNQVLGLSRRDRRRLRAMAHQLGKKPDSERHLTAKLTGHLAYLSMLNPDQASAIHSSPCS